ncbi:hypothetical protein [Granulicella sibirica]|uniref:Uncharacterized protein n=1 Tax=Granulicella sibirica TaxID=2479048 RepID=A0A4V1L626_9BACT|nr:hypothetical protein [Granulicella sibirica]RXH57794.1 hypothetical protein GRAN_1104 [Granulicella sibirica]
MRLDLFRRIQAAYIATARILFLSMIATSAIAQGADPFAGTWVWNPKASQLANQKLSITATGDHKYTIDDHFGVVTTLVADGTPQPSAGGTLSLKQIDANTWQSTYTGATGTSGTYKISPDGQTMKRDQLITWADGGKENRESDWQRLGSGKGLAGEWQSKSVDTKSESKPFKLLITPAESSSLVFTFPSMKLSYLYKFDGKDYADPDPQAPKGFTLATKRTGTSTIHVDTKINGSPDGTADYEISSDGRTMKVREVNKGQPAPIFYTLEKQ